MTRDDILDKYHKKAWLADKLVHEKETCLVPTIGTLPQAGALTLTLTLTLTFTLILTLILTPIGRPGSCTSWSTRRN